MATDRIPVREGCPELRLRPRGIEGCDQLAAGPDPRVDLHHPLVEHLGEHDAKVEEARPRLVADPKRVPEPPVDDEQGAVPLALEERVGRDGRAHLDRVDPPHGLAGRDAEDLPDPMDGGVPVVLRVVGQELVGDEAALRPAGDHVGERAAPIDPELPAAAHGRSAAHRMLRVEGEKRFTPAGSRAPGPGSARAIIASFAVARRVSRPANSMGFFAEDALAGRRSRHGTVRVRGRLVVRQTEKITNPSNRR